MTKIIETVGRGLRAIAYILGSCALFALCVIALTSLAQPETAQHTPYSPETTRPNFDPAQETARFLTQHEELIAQFEERDTQARYEALEELAQYYDQKEVLIDDLIEDLFSFGSKIKMSWWQVWGNTEKLEAYVREKWENCMGSAADDEWMFNLVVEQLQQDLLADHNQLLVAMSSALAAEPLEIDMSGFSLPEAVDSNLAQQLAIDAGGSVSLGAAALAVDLFVVNSIATGLVQVGGRIAAALGMSLSTEAGVMGASAAFSWESFGISLVVGAIVWVVVDWVQEKTFEADAREQILAELGEQKRQLTEAFDRASDAGLQEWQEARRTALAGATLDFFTQVGMGGWQ